MQPSLTVLDPTGQDENRSVLRLRHSARGDAPQRVQGWCPEQDQIIESPPLTEMV